MSIALNSALLASQAVSQEVGLAGNLILTSAAGFAAARYDVDDKPSNALFMQEARPVLEALLPELEAEKLETAEVREALSHLEGDLDGGVEASLWMMKLATTLEGFSRNGEAYARAANRIWQSERFVFASAKHAAQARQVYRFTQNRELLASLPPYSKRYLELGPVARGGQATIYLVEALDENGARTGRQYVARKIHGAESVGRFYDYAKALQILDHPNIVQPHEITVDNGDFIIIMEIAPGQSLKAHLEHSPPLSAEHILNLRGQLLGALRYAWGCGIIHRDLKPNNVMMRFDKTTGDMLVTLLDFGMAKFKAVDSRSSSMGKGTFLYWAPEQFEGGKITEATDIYQMGLVLLDLVRGRMRADTILEKDPLAEITELRALRAGDPAMQKLLDEIAVMCNRDPQKRMKILGMLGVKEQPFALSDTELVEVEVEGSEVKEVEEIAPTSLSLDLYADISAESAMAMVDQTPPRWRGDPEITYVAVLGTGLLAFVDYNNFFTGGFPDTNILTGVILGNVAGLFVASMPFWLQRRSSEEILKERAIKKLKSILEKSGDEELRASAAKALIETDHGDAFSIFKNQMDDRKTRKLAIWGLGEVGPEIMAQDRSDRRWSFENYLLDEAVKWERQEFEWFLSALKKIYPSWAPLLDILYNEKEDTALYSKIPSSQENERFLGHMLKKGSLRDEFDDLKRYCRAAKALGSMRRQESAFILFEAFNRYMFHSDVPRGPDEYMKRLGEEIIQSFIKIGGAESINYLERLRLKINNSVWSAKITAAQHQIRQAMK